MQFSEYPQEQQCRVSGSENIPSHKGTPCIDTATDMGRGYEVAHADIKVVKIDRQANTVWFTTLEEVDAPIGANVLTNRKAHMNDVDFNEIGFYIGKVFRKGERCYRQGFKKADIKNIHIHNEWGTGVLKGNGWHENAYGVYTMDVTGKLIHYFEACYLKQITGEPFRFGDSKLYPQDKYIWKHTPEVTYRAHIQNIGDSVVSTDGEVCGTVGNALRIESVFIHGHCTFRIHQQDTGWTDVVRDKWCGEKFHAKRLEAIEIIADEGYTIEANSHVQNIGWQGVKTGKQVLLGTTGQALRLEAFTLKIVKV